MKRKRQPDPTEVIDTGPKERHQHHHIVVEQTGLKAGEVRIRSLTSNPLDAYHAREWITKAQWQGGDTLRNKFELAGMSPGVTGSLEPSIGGSRDFTEAQLRARADVNRAMQRLGMKGASIALNVCCYGISLTDVERLLGWRPGYGMIRLREALDDLADMFGHTRPFRPVRILVAIGEHLGVLVSS